MYQRKSKYSKQKNSELEFETLEALMKFPGEYLTIDGIKCANGYSLGGVTSQKMSRVLGSLIDMGLAKKKKDGNRMTYCSLATRGDDDEVHTPFETEEGNYTDFTFTPAATEESPVEINWELDTERGLK